MTRSTVRNRKYILVLWNGALLVAGFPSWAEKGWSIIVQPVPFTGKTSPRTRFPQYCRGILSYQAYIPSLNIHASCKLLFGIKFEICQTAFSAAYVIVLWNFPTAKLLWSSYRSWTGNDFIYYPPKGSDISCSCSRFVGNGAVTLYKSRLDTENCLKVLIVTWWWVLNKY